MPSPSVLTAAERGFGFAEVWPIGLAFCGLALFAAVGALSHQHERAFSASLVYLALGLVAGLAIDLLDLRWIGPIRNSGAVEHLAEFAVIVALFGAGLKLDRPLRWREWSGVSRLLIVAMPLTIAGVTLFGYSVIGLSLGGAIILGAVLAPTDPVLAGDVGVGPPGEGQEHEPNFALTGEAGLNDGLAFPFLFLGLFIAGPDVGWFGTWLLADVVYAITVGVLLGATVGYGLAALAVRLRDRELLSPAFDAWLAIPSVLLIYGLTETAGAYGFIAAFAGGLAFRRYERTHEYNRRVHDGAEMTEKVLELVVILALGSMLSIRGLGEPGLAGWLLIPVLLLLIRPAAVAISLAGSNLPRSERLFVGWFGVRGIGSLYYVAVASSAGVLSSTEISIVTWTAIATVVVSIVVHGMTAAPLSQRLLPEQR